MTFLIAGTSGAGKTSVARRLAELGHAVLDTDRDRDLAQWTTLDGEFVDWADTRIQDPEWVAAHRWRWVPARVADLLAADPPAEVWAGMCENLELFADHFTVLHLWIPGATALARVMDPARANPWGKDPAIHDLILDGTERIDARLAALGAERIDARRPLDEVVAEIVGRIGAGRS